MDLSAGTSSFEGMVTSFRRMGGKEVLLALLTWAENHGLDTAKEAALDWNTWARTRQFIMQAASRGDESAIKVIKPRKLILDVTRLLNTGAHSEDWVPWEETAGELGTLPSPQRRPPMAAPPGCTAPNAPPAPAPLPAEPLSTHPRSGNAPAGDNEPHYAIAPRRDAVRRRNAPCLRGAAVPGHSTPAFWLGTL